MSAYIVSKSHIDALVKLSTEGVTVHGSGPDFAWYGPGTIYAADGSKLDVRALTGDELGALLIAENIASVSARYGGEDVDTLPGPVDKTDLLDYHYSRPERRLSPVEALQALAGYEYQSCEHEGWDSSIAKGIVLALRQTIITKLDGWDTADTWEITADQIRRPMKVGEVRPGRVAGSTITAEAIE